MEWEAGAAHPFWSLLCNLCFYDIYNLRKFRTLYRWWYKLSAGHRLHGSHTVVLRMSSHVHCFPRLFIFLCSIFLLYYKLLYIHASRSYLRYVITLNERAFLLASSQASLDVPEVVNPNGMKS